MDVPFRNATQRYTQLEIMSQVPILKHDKAQVWMSLYYENWYQYLTLTYILENFQYMLLAILYEYNVPSKDLYVPLIQQQLTWRNCIDAMYKSKNVHLIWHRSKSTCTSSI